MESAVSSKIVIQDRRLRLFYALASGSIAMVAWWIGLLVADFDSPVFWRIVRVAIPATLLYAVLHYVIAPAVLWAVSKHLVILSLVMLGVGILSWGYFTAIVIIFEFPAPTTNVYLKWYQSMPVFVLSGFAKLVLLQDLIRLRQMHHDNRNAKFHNLQARIYPHFIFNALNSIASIVEARPAVAEEAILDLADVLRASISTPNTLVRLEDELTMALKYANIEALRWEGLEVETRVDNDCLAVMVPSLLIQPLVENAVYHGISKRGEGGVIEVIIDHDGSWIKIEVTNPLANDPNAQKHKGNGFALSSIERRLELMYEFSDFHTQVRGDQFVASIAFDVDSYLVVDDVDQVGKATQ